MISLCFGQSQSSCWTEQPDHIADMVVVSRHNSKALHRIYKSMLKHPDAFVQDLQQKPTDHDNK